MVMLSIALANSKPGTGKTTSAVWLAHAFHEAGQSVVLADADPGESTLEWADQAGGFPFRVLPMASKTLDRRIRDYVSADDVVIVDSPQLEDSPGITKAVLRFAGEVVVPCAPTTIEISRTVPVLAAIGEVNAERPVPARCCALLNRTIANANSTAVAREALTAAGFTVLGMTVPRLEVFAQSFGAPVEAAGPIWRVIAGELANRAELAEVTR
jgi:chromosome partitioning protein